MIFSHHKTLRSWFLGLAVLIVGLDPCLSLAKTEGVSITDPWVRQPPSSQKITALYGTIKNNSPTPVTVVGVTLEDAAQCEIHQTVIDTKGVASMNHQPTYALKPGESLDLTPGGYHVMVMGLKKELKKGESLKGSVLLQGGGTISLEASVR